jgi:hypothetical protein
MQWDRRNPVPLVLVERPASESDTNEAAVDYRKYLRFDIVQALLEGKPLTEAHIRCELESGHNLGALRPVLTIP